MSDGLFVGIDNIVVNGFTSLLSGLASSYGPMLDPLIKAFLMLYLIYCGHKVLAGRMENPFVDIVWECGRIAIIWAFVNNAGGWYDAIVAAINGIRDGFSGDAGGIWGLLDTVWDKTQSVASTLHDLDKDTFPIEGTFAEVIVWGGSLVMILIAATVNLTAEITLMILLAVGPLFIGCLIWGWLRGMFDTWMKEIIGCLLTVLFSAFGIQIAMVIFDKVMTAASNVAEGRNIMTLAFECFGGAIMSAMLLKLSAQLAGSLANASAQAAAQGMAKAGLSAPGDAGKALYKRHRESSKNEAREQRADARFERLGNAMNSEQGMKLSSKAAIERMKALNSLSGGK